MSNYDVFIGIDPGASGGIAVITAADSWAITMPETEMDLVREVAYISKWTSSICLIEKVHAMPGQGVTSMFNFGRAYQSVRTAMFCNMIPFDDVQPAKWQREFSLPTLKESGGSNTVKKNHHKAKAQQLFPHIQVTHKIADALLIAEFCRRTRG